MFTITTCGWSLICFNHMFSLIIQNVVFVWSLLFAWIQKNMIFDQSFNLLNLKYEHPPKELDWIINSKYLHCRKLIIVQFRVEGFFVSLYMINLKKQTTRLEVHVFFMGHSRPRKPCNPSKTLDPTSKAFLQRTWEIWCYTSWYLLTTPNKL